MHAIKIHGAIRKKPVCYIVSEQEFDVEAAHQQFMQQYCVGPCEDKDERPFLRMTELRLALWKNRRELELKSDPLLDDLYRLFAEWCAAMYNVFVLEEETFEILERTVTVHDFIFELS